MAWRYAVWLHFRTDPTASVNDCPVRIPWGKRELFSPRWSWILLSFCAHYLPRIKKIHHKNSPKKFTIINTYHKVYILLVILQQYSALLSILIHFNWSAVENKRKSGLTQMAERISESLIHFYLSVIMTFWVNLTEVINQSLLKLLPISIQIGRFVSPFAIGLWLQF